jgi:hypothetical protein
MIKRNPGVALIWTTKKYKLYENNGGVLFRLISEPEHCKWFCEGREATREEVLHSIETGKPILMKIAEEEGPKAVKLLEEMVVKAMRYLPGGAQDAQGVFFTCLRITTSCLRALW